MFVFVLLFADDKKFGLAALGGDERQDLRNQWALRITNLAITSAPFRRGNVVFWGGPGVGMFSYLAASVLALCIRCLSMFAHVFGFSVHAFVHMFIGKTTAAKVFAFVMSKLGLYEGGLHEISVNSFKSTLANGSSLNTERTIVRNLDSIIIIGMESNIHPRNARTLLTFVVYFFRFHNGNRRSLSIDPEQRCRTRCIESIGITIRSVARIDYSHFGGLPARNGKTIYLQ